MPHVRVAIEEPIFRFSSRGLRDDWRPIAIVGDKDMSRTTTPQHRPAKYPVREWITAGYGQIVPLGLYFQRQPGAKVSSS